MVNIIRAATGLQINPVKVSSIYDYGDGLLEEFFGIKPTQGENCLSFRKKDVLEPFLTENNTMLAYIEPELKKRLEDRKHSDSFSSKVRNVLVELIPAGEDNVESVAKELATSVRTLQRKLSHENTTYNEQMNQTKELLARNYLEEGKVNNDDIAFLVGYSDANTFQRAFRNWTGMSVGEYKKSMI